MSCALTQTATRQKYVFVLFVPLNDKCDDIAGERIPERLKNKIKVIQKGVWTGRDKKVCVCAWVYVFVGGVAVALS